MMKLHLNLRALLAIIVLSPAVATVAAMDDARESLLKSSPFVPYKEPVPETVAPPPPAPVVGPLSRELVFNGVLDIGGETLFSIFDKSLNQSLLLSMNEAGSRFSVISFNASGDRSIQVKSGSRVETLSLATSDGSPIPTTMPTASRNIDNNLRPSATVSGSNETAERRPPQVPRRRIIPRRRGPTEGE
ncbi:MAG: hypothetical protein ACQKBV_04310 [Puniceicoccales bacterium]